MLRQRIGSAAVLVPFLLVVLVLGEPWIALLIAAAVAVGAVEAFRLLRSAGYPALPLVGVVAALVVAADAAAPATLNRSEGLLVGIVLVVLAIGAFTRPDPRDGLATWIVTVFGAVYAGQLGFIVRIGTAGPQIPSDAPLAQLGSERGWILLLVLAVWAFDTSAYFVGRRFGRRKFLAHLSPSKTLAGVIGGLVSSTIVTLVGGWALGQPLLPSLVLGPLVGFAAQAGDLAESMLKRAAGAKDSGTLIPGHGGMLDRIDSFLFAAPVATACVVSLFR